MRVAPPRRSWRSKLASAFRRSGKKANIQQQCTQEETSAKTAQVSWETQLPWTGPLEVGNKYFQRQSPLFGLPLEIRNVIYENVFGPSLIHIVVLEDRLGHVRCQHWQSSDSWGGHVHCHPGVTPINEQGIVEIHNDEDPNDQLLALCTTCRLVYNEALPFMLSTPLFTMQSPFRTIVTNRTSLGTLNNIRNLNLKFSFLNLPARQSSEALVAWIRACQTLASMSSLRFLCIYINQDNFDLAFRTQQPERVEERVRWLLEPLNTIRNVKDRGGRFDVITTGWTQPFAIDKDPPFDSIQGKLPPCSELAKRMRSLGEFSQADYLKLVSMPWPIMYRS